MSCSQRRIGLLENDLHWDCIREEAFVSDFLKIGELFAIMLVALC